MPDADQLASLKSELESFSANALLQLVACAGDGQHWRQFGVVGNLLHPKWQESAEATQTSACVKTIARKSVHCTPSVGRQNIGTLQAGRAHF